MEKISNFKWWKCRGCRKEWDEEDMINDHGAFYCPYCRSSIEFKGDTNDFDIYDRYRLMLEEKIKKKGEK